MQSTDNSQQLTVNSGAEPSSLRGLIPKQSRIHTTRLLRYARNDEEEKRNDGQVKNVIQ
ncbi:hypothetical protein [Dysgonomonas sp.]